jgi:hypothetical protein
VARRVDRPTLSPRRRGRTAADRAAYEDWLDRYLDRRLPAKLEEGLPPLYLRDLEPEKRDRYIEQGLRSMARAWPDPGHWVHSFLDEGGEG